MREMIKQMYSLYDKQTNTYMNPLHLLNDGDAVRLAQSWANGDKNSNPYRYPHQFVMVYVGDFDDATGKFENKHKEVAELSQFKNAEREFTISDVIDEVRNYLKEK